MNDRLKTCLPPGLRVAMCVAACHLLLDAAHADDFKDFVRPLFQGQCVACHGAKKNGKVKIKGKVNLLEITSAKKFKANAELIEDMIDAIDAYDMPPEDEPELDAKDRLKLLAVLKDLLIESSAKTEIAQAPVRRLNRFQYSNSLKDLFKLKKDVFVLPEKMMTRYSPHLGAKDGKMPEKLDVACLSLQETGGFKNVEPYPQDLRAEHGYANQASQLTLSPLLLDSFLTLSLSILDSPDFNEKTVGLWNEYFKEPDASEDVETVVRKRLHNFLHSAFRRPVDTATVDRYVAYAMTHITSDMPFTDSMKKATSAILCSPLFLYRYDTESKKDDQFELASRLSYFLWGSAPDATLLVLAKQGKLSDPAVLAKMTDHMMADPKIERFLDSFPAQWLQLENILAATPDPEKFRLYHVDEKNPASMHMLLEPLLLFESVFIENRPIIELLSPEYTYRSEFLTDWYTSDLLPPEVDFAKVLKDYESVKVKTEALKGFVGERKKALAAYEKSIPELMKQAGTEVDIKPGLKAWGDEQKGAAADILSLSPWKQIGPFGGANFDEAHNKAFIDPAAADGTKAYDGKTWKEKLGFVDGKNHNLTGANSANYLFREALVGRDRQVDVKLGSDDSVIMWVNGVKVHDHKVSRGVNPARDDVKVNLKKGSNRILLKIANGGGGYGFFFQAEASKVPTGVAQAVLARSENRTASQKEAILDYYLSIAPEMEPARKEVARRTEELKTSLTDMENELKNQPKPPDHNRLKQEARRNFDNVLRGKMRSRQFKRVKVEDPRYGGVMTSAATLTMTSGPKDTKPISRGAWVIEVVFNDPPPPPPNDVPALDENAGPKNQTIREKFAAHRSNERCASCHARIDPLGFVLENFDSVGRWRNRYENKREVDASGTVFKRHDFADIVAFKDVLIKEEERFAKAFTAHLLRFALARELNPKDSLVVEDIVAKTEKDKHGLRSIMREIVFSDSFLQTR